MDINLKRRKREISIAKEIALAWYSAAWPTISANATPYDQLRIDTRDRLIEQINIACEKHQLAEPAAKRVIAYVDKELDKMTNEAARAV